jgi:hypothetical protein
MVFLNRSSATTSPQLSRNPSVASVRTKDHYAPEYTTGSSSTLAAPYPDSSATSDPSPVQSPDPQNSTSVFKSRSRSNSRDLMTSMLSLPSPGTPLSSGSDSSSQYGMEADQRPLKARSMLPRSRKLKRHSSKLSFGSVLDGMGDLVQTKAASNRGPVARPSSALQHRSGGVSPVGMLTALCSSGRFA